jgi:hypothetical protein
MHASKWKDIKLVKKRAHATRIEVQHGSWGMFPDKDNYARYLRKKRRSDKNEAKIEQRFLFGEILLIAAEKERKKAKEKLILKEGECHFERKPLPDWFIRGRVWNE